MVHEKIILSLFLFTLLVLALARTTSAESVQVPYCSPVANYTNASLFQTNLQNALAINTADINHGFYNFSGGRNADRVDVIGLCRGDIGRRNCRSCLDDSGDTLQKLCPNQKEAIIWSDDCMIRTANRSILHKNETSPSFYLRNEKNASNPSVFNKAVSGLLDNLRAKAAAGGSRLKYATGDTNSTTPSEKIFGLVQCTPDLSPVQCNNCLNWSLGYLPDCCNGKVGGRILAPSCNFRYEIYPFYGQTTPANTPPPAPQASAPPPPAPQAGTPPPVPQADAPPPAPQADAPPPSDGQKPDVPASPPAPTDGPPPPPPPPPPQGGGGGGNRNPVAFRLLTVTTTVAAILIF